MHKRKGQGILMWDAGFTRRANMWEFLFFIAQSTAQWFAVCLASNTSVKYQEKIPKAIIPTEFFQNWKHMVIWLKKGVR